MKDEEDETPRRFRRLQPNPLRDVLPWVVVVVGAFLVGRGALTLSRGGAEQLFIGLGLAVLGVVVFLINRWQSKRRH